MLDSKNTDVLIDIARDNDTPAATRVSACTLIYRLSAIPAKEVIAILQETIDDSRTKSGVKVKAMDLIDKINTNTGHEPELRSEDETLVKTKLMEKYLVCPQSQT
jgi:uncharacterized protein (UPF0147 family)